LGPSGFRRWAVLRCGRLRRGEKTIRVKPSGDAGGTRLKGRLQKKTRKGSEGGPLFLFVKTCTIKGRRGTDEEKMPAKTRK